MIRPMRGSLLPALGLAFLLSGCGHAATPPAGAPPAAVVPPAAVPPVAAPPADVPPIRTQSGVLSAPAKQAELEHIRIRLVYGAEAPSGVAVCKVNAVVIPFDALKDPAAMALRSHLEQLLREGGQVPLTIDADYHVPTRNVVSALNAAMAAGFKEINFTVPDFIRRAPHSP